MLRFAVVCLVVVVVIPGLALAQDPDPRGLILVSSRTEGLLTQPNLEGPTIGDVCMLALLQNAGYRGKVVVDQLLADEIALYVDPPTVELVILSGSSASANVQPVPPGLPAMMGEHVTLKDPGRPGYIPFFMAGTDSGDRNRWPQDVPNTTQFMKIVN